MIESARLAGMMNNLLDDFSLMTDTPVQIIEADDYHRYRSRIKFRSRIYGPYGIARVNRDDPTRPKMIDEDLQVYLNVTEYGDGDPEINNYSIQLVFQDRTDGVILNSNADGLPIHEHLYSFTD